MNKIEKEQIREKLVSYCERYGSQNKAAASLTKVSSATISQVLNYNWELVADEMWRNIGSQIGYKANKWNVVETRAFTRMKQIIKDAQEYSNVYAVIGDAGTGKSESMKAYRDNNPNAYHLSCNEYWNKKLFLQELLQEMGKSSGGYTIGEMMSEVVRTLKQKDNPVLMLDEVDKLSDQLLYFFITLYNNLEDHCGIVLSATDHFEKRITRGLRLNKKGFKEIFSRMGRKFIPLQTANRYDITAICMANGVEDKKQIEIILKEADENGNDLRRVKRKIHALKQKENTI